MGRTASDAIINWRKKLCDFPPCSLQAKYVCTATKSKKVIHLCAEHTIQLDRMRLGWEIDHRPVVDLW